ncbi:MAG: YcgN family cysteine cluster protein [Rhodobacteraceae bacterium]|nr:YcgN family cysteine cluster protein [Paracoccaceae bacterium]
MRARRPPPVAQGLRSRFWERIPLAAMRPAEWEALCDGCGRCCLNKLEDPDTHEVAYTRVACRLLDAETCRCSRYASRRTYVPDCVVLTPATIGRVAYWMPPTCAYRCLHEGRPLAPWHPLVSGDPDSVHAAGISVAGWTVPEYEVAEEEWEDHIVDLDGDEDAPGRAGPALAAAAGGGDGGEEG